MAPTLEGVRTGAVAPAARDDAQGRFRAGEAVGFVEEELVAWGEPRDDSARGARAARGRRRADHLPARRRRAARRRDGPVASLRRGRARAVGPLKKY